MRILIDLDDTLVDMTTKSLYYYNGWAYRSRPELKLDDLIEWELPDRHIFEEIWRIPGFFTDLPFMDDAAATILRLLKMMGHELVIVTAPPTWKACEGKYQWVHTNLLIPGIIDSMEQLVLTRGKHYIEGECMIDDKPENLVGRKYPVLFTRPWNKQATAIPRVYSWDGVRRHITNNFYTPAEERDLPYGYERERGA